MNVKQLNLKGGKLKFNINNEVRVKLTPEGKAWHKKDHEEFWNDVGVDIKYAPPVEDAEGWSRWQLWHLMERFGPFMCAGGPLMFETDIDIVCEESVKC